jgi:hypothetical protein
MNNSMQKNRRKLLGIGAFALLWIGISASAIWSVDSAWVRLLLLAIAVGVTIHVSRLKLAAPVTFPSADTVA